MPIPRAMMEPLMTDIIADNLKKIGPAFDADALGGMLAGDDDRSGRPLLATPDAKG